VPVADVEDVIQDVLIVVHRRLPVYEPRAPMEGWLYGIVRRTVKDWRRAQRRADERLQRLPPGHGSPNADEEIHLRRAERRLREFLDTLDPRHRLVFTLADIDGSTAVEIARVLHIKLPTTYSRLRAARARLRRFLATPEATRGPGGTQQAPPAPRQARRPISS
jgi:RNA polymerase sigma-70 factor (ECF subfamily)